MDINDLKKLNRKRIKLGLVVLLIILAATTSYYLAIYGKRRVAIQKASDVLFSQSTTQEKLNLLQEVAKDYYKNPNVDISTSKANYDVTECQELFGLWFTWKDNNENSADLVWEVMKSKECPLN